MFGFFKKKTCNDPTLLAMIEKHGLDTNAFHIAGHLAKNFLHTKQHAYLFILQELDGASNGDKKSINFVKNSGIAINEYGGALGRDMPKNVDDASFYLVGISSGLHPLKDLTVDLRLRVLFFIMDSYLIGNHKALRGILGVEI